MRALTLLKLVAAVSQFAVACGSPAPQERANPSDGTMGVDAATAGGLDAAAALPDGDDASPPPTVRGTVLPEFLADAANQWARLIAVNWELAAGYDVYLCARMTVPRDAYIHEFSTLTSPGTHHAVLVLDEFPSGPDGVAVCAVDRSGRQIYDSNDFTAGTAGSMILPDGIAMRVRAGEQLVLNLHLLNSGGARATGNSGVLVRTLQEAEVKNLAQSVLTGPHRLRISPGSVQQQARCPLPHDGTIFAVAPHMHELGTYMKVVAQSAAGDVVLFDGRYSFDFQHLYVTDFVKLQAGDVIQIECSYENTTARSVGFGPSAQDEMCFVALSIFPAPGEAFYSCSD
jgi:hypothetical protein